MSFFGTLTTLAGKKSSQPFIIGLAASFLLISSIPVSKEDEKKSQFTNPKSHH
jgi:hypothetical protein